MASALARACVYVLVSGAVVVSLSESNARGAGDVAIGVRTESDNALLYERPLVCRLAATAFACEIDEATRRRLTQQTTLFGTLLTALPVEVHGAAKADVALGALPPPSVGVCTNLDGATMQLDVVLARLSDQRHMPFVRLAWLHAHRWSASTLRTFARRYTWLEFFPRK